MNTQLKELILNEKLIAICRGVEASKCMSVAEALYNGGFRLMEITFDLKHPDSWQVTADSIAAVSREYRGRMEVGAGTVVSVELVELAAKAGARFIISPDTSHAVIRRTKELGLISMPGALTPSEATAAHEAGADFVKTSTGKIDVAATPEAAVVMCQAVRDYYEKTGRKVGFKPAGGVRTAADAVLYYTIVREILGEEWLTPRFFRIGASSAANALLSAVEGRPVKYY